MNGQSDSEGKDHGVLVALLMEDRYLQIAVGYGLEARITDQETARIRKEIMNPRLKSGRLYEAVCDGANALIRAANGETIGRKSAALPEYAPTIETTDASDQASENPKPRPNPYRYANGDLTVTERGRVRAAMLFGVMGALIGGGFFLIAARWLGLQFHGLFEIPQTQSNSCTINVRAGRHAAFIEVASCYEFRRACGAVRSRIIFYFVIISSLLCCSALYPALLMGQKKYLKKRAKAIEAKRIDPFQHGVKFFFAIL